MSATALLILVIFALVIWGGLVAAAVALSHVNDDTCGELGDAPGTDNASLMAGAR